MKNSSVQQAFDDDVGSLRSRNLLVEHHQKRRRPRTIVSSRAEPGTGVDDVAAARLEDLRSRLGLGSARES